MNDSNLSILLPSRKATCVTTWMTGGEEQIHPFPPISELPNAMCYLFLYLSPTSQVVFSNDEVNAVKLIMEPFPAA